MANQTYIHTYIAYIHGCVCMCMYYACANARMETRMDVLWDLERIFTSGRGDFAPGVCMYVCTGDKGVVLGL